MNGLVPFDQTGAFGPAMALIYKTDQFSQEDVVSVAQLLKENFTKLAKVKIKGKKEFFACVAQKKESKSFLTPSEIIATKFFQNMQRPEPSIYHEKVLDFIVPRMMKVVHDQIPSAHVDEAGEKQVNQWLASFIESYMNDEQIQKHCELQNTVCKEAMDERVKVGIHLSQLATTKQLTENDFNIFVNSLADILKEIKNADNRSLTLEILGKYLMVSSMNKADPIILGEDIHRSLSTIFKEKMFPKDI